LISGIYGCGTNGSDGVTDFFSSMARTGSLLWKLTQGNSKSDKAYVVYTKQWEPDIVSDAMAAIDSCEILPMAGDGGRVVMVKVARGKTWSL